jgi:hypothetical protein
MVRNRGAHLMAHRAAYELAHGPVPPGMVLDHRCRERTCINPAHLEPVPNRENVLRGVGPSAVNARKTACKRGHPLAGPNLYRMPDGRRQCRACLSVAREAHRMRSAA